MPRKKTLGQKRKARARKADVKGKIPGFVEGYQVKWLKELGEEHPEYKRLSEKYPKEFKNA